MMKRPAVAPTPYRSTEAALAGLDAGKFPRGHLLAFQTSKKWTQGLWKKYFHVEHSTASRSLEHLMKLGLIWRGPRIRLEGTPGASHVYYLSSLGGRVLQRITTNTFILGIRAASGAKDAHDLAILSLALAGEQFLRRADVSLQTRWDIPIEWRTWRQVIQYQQLMTAWEAQHGREPESSESNSERPVPSRELQIAHGRARTNQSLDGWLLDYRPSIVTLMPDIGGLLQADDDGFDLLCLEVETTSDYKHILQKYQQLTKIIKLVQGQARLWVIVVFISQSLLDRARRWHEMAFWRAGGRPSFYPRGRQLEVCLTTLPTALKQLEEGNILTLWEASSVLEPKPIDRVRWTMKTVGRR